MFKLSIAARLYAAFALLAAIRHWRCGRKAATLRPGRDCGVWARCWRPRLLIVGRSIARLREITRVTETVAGGAAGVAIPYVGRHDEIGALARSIGVFQQAMRRNEELQRPGGKSEARASSASSASRSQASAVRRSKRARRTRPHLGA